MTISTPLRVWVIEKHNSVSFLQALFDAYAVGVPAVLVDDVAAAIPGARVEKTIQPKLGGGWFDGQSAPNFSDAPAQVTFTSGTTGRPKPVALSYRALADVVSRLTDAMAPDATIREYVGAPVYYSFGLARVRSAAAVGGKCYIPENGFDPLEFARMLEAGDINAFSAVPTLIRVILDNAALFEACGSKLRWMEIGSQYMSRQEKEAIKKLFPNAKIVQHYGLTEASRSTFLDISSLEGAALESVGSPNGDVEVEISDDGRIRIKGSHVALGLLSGNKIKPFTDEDGWLVTNDLGRIEDGLLFFEGRADDIINVGGVKISPELFDERLENTLGARNMLASARIPDKARGEGIFIAVDRAANLDLSRVRREALKVSEDLGVAAAGAIKIQSVDSLPRTQTGKLKRQEISVLYESEKEPLTEVAGAPQLTPREAEIAAIWRSALGVEQVDAGTSFFDMGGDSLSAINIMLRMERAGVDPALCRQIFEGLTIGEIAASEGGSVKAKKPAAAQVSDGINATRGLMVLALIAGHWLPFILDRLPNSDALYYYANPFLRLGTPGFAIIYGLGLGYFQFPLFQTNRHRMRKNQRLSLMIVGGGILVMAAVSLLTIWRGGSEINEQWPTQLFYSVILFYFISIALLGPLFRILSVGKYTVLNCLILAATLFLISSYLMTYYPHADTVGFVNLGRLMLVAKYNIFLMTGVAMLGMAIGLWIRRHLDKEDLGVSICLAGVALFLGGLAIALATNTGELWFSAKITPLPLVISYLGITALAFSIMHYFAGRFYDASLGRFLMRCLSVTGLLSLFLYIGHGLAEPVKTLLVGSGIPEAIALAAALAAFFGVWFYAGRRLYRLYYG